MASRSFESVEEGEDFGVMKSTLIDVMGGVRYFEVYWLALYQ